ncbi:hypothetical protein SDC9_212686 [bioreactor metagenome]|uniref:Uncharacterized protein n=1 Tax=bioreactor metagenome TaxID=1076179 RepID=A0A645JMM3_9ZZZZ
MQRQGARGKAQKLVVVQQCFSVFCRGDGDKITFGQGTNVVHRRFVPHGGSLTQQAHIVKIAFAVDLVVRRVDIRHTFPFDQHPDILAYPAFQRKHFPRVIPLQYSDGSEVECEVSLQVVCFNVVAQQALIVDVSHNGSLWPLICLFSKACYACTPQAA